MSNHPFKICGCVFTALLIFGCSPTQERDTPEEYEYGIIDREELLSVVAKIRSRGVEVDTYVDGELQYVRWQSSDDEIVRNLICEESKGPPPDRRSVLLGQPLDKDLIIAKLNGRGIEYYIHSYALAEYLVWAEQDFPDVEEVFTELYGMGPRLSEDLEAI